MEQIKIFFKSDFKIWIRSEAGFGVPFKFRFFTNSPQRAYHVCYDGHTYHNCHLLDDGRLVVAFDDHGLGLGKLMVEMTFYLTDEDYKTALCDRVIHPKPVLSVDDDGLESEIYLSLQGDHDIGLGVQVPQFYQIGPKGDPFRYSDFTPEQIHELQAPAIEAAAEAEKRVGDALEQVESVDENTKELKKAISNLPDGQAASAMAAQNKADIEQMKRVMAVSLADIDERLNSLNNG